MGTELPRSDPKALWQHQNLGGEAMSLEHVRTRASQLAARTVRRRRQQRVAWSVALAGMIAAIWLLPTAIMRGGCAVVIATTLVALGRSHARRRSATDPDELNAAAGRDFLRGRLIDRREAVRDVLRWQIAPVIAGVAISLIGMYLDAPERWPWLAGVWALASVQVMVARWRLDRAIRNYDREIASLSAD